MSTSEGNKKPRADAVRNRELALEAATALLTEPGGAPLTVEAIAARAGLGVGTVARAFGGKAALLDAAVANLLEPVVRRGQELAREEAPLPALYAFLRELIAFQARHHGLNEGLTGLELPRVTALRGELVDAVRSLFTAAQTAGEIRRDVDVDTATALIGETAFAVARTTGTDHEALRNAYLAVLLDGLRAGAPNHSGRASDAQGTDLVWNMGSHVPHQG